jgi:adenylosuccinate lyase
MNHSKPSPLDALSPVDGRYHATLSDLSHLVSERALIRTRALVELAWLDHIAVPLGIAFSATDTLRSAVELPEDFPEAVKAHERTTNHDVKAMEYALRDHLGNCGVADDLISLLHFACTSEDINNIAYALMLRDVREQILIPRMDQLIASLDQLARRYKSTAMLSRTHGQTASPTTLGKEVVIFAERLRRQRQRFASVAILAKMNGAVGNFNAHLAAAPELDWQTLSRTFVEGRMGLVSNRLTTQIESHDWIAEYMYTLKLFNSIALGLSRDMWGYISLGYFKLAVTAGEVGSSTMPHKVNPIDFENAEGNLGMSSAQAEYLAEKLPVSRWQRDLSDSTVLRNLGVVCAHAQLAYDSLMRGIAKLHADEECIAADLNVATEVLGEALQSSLRRYGVTDAYERVKAASRGISFGAREFAALVDSCEEFPEAEKARLKSLKPSSYTGLAERLVDDYFTTYAGKGRS